MEIFLFNSLNKRATGASEAEPSKLSNSYRPARRKKCIHIHFLFSAQSIGSDRCGHASAIKLNHVYATRVSCPISPLCISFPARHWIPFGISSRSFFSSFFFLLLDLSSAVAVRTISSGLRLERQSRKKNHQWNVSGLKFRPLADYPKKSRTFCPMIIHRVLLTLVKNNAILNARGKKYIFYCTTYCFPSL